MKRKLLPACLLSALISLSVHASLDQAYFKRLHMEKVTSSDRVTWTQIGPGMSGYCEAFWCHPTDPNVMFMSPDMFNSYGTWDNGRSWQTIKDCDANGSDMRRVQGMAFSHQHPAFGYAADVRGQLFHTTDLGHTWSLVDSFDAPGGCSELSVDPTDDHNWYLGAGDFWNVKKNHRTQDRAQPYVNQFAAYGCIYKSTDQGGTWQKITRGFPASLDVGRIIVDPTDSKTIILAANSGVYRSTDQGESWALSGAGLPVNWPRDMTSFHDAKTGRFVLYVVLQTTFAAEGKTVKSNGGVYQSLDHGKTWSNISGNLAVNLQEIHSNFARTRFWSGLADWFGLEKNAAQAKFPELPVSVFSVFNRIVVNSLNPEEIFISQNVKHDEGFIPGDVWKTSDGGKTWIATARTGNYWASGQDDAYWASRHNPTSPNTTYAHLQPEVDRLEETSGNRFMRISTRGNLFACFDQQVMRSNDGGETWDQADDIQMAPGSRCWEGRGDSNLPGRYLLLETGVRDRYFLCSGEHGLWQTCDLSELTKRGPVAVKQLEGQLNKNGAHSIAAVAVNPKNPDVIYILMFRQEHRGQFRRSIDGGKTWTDVSKPIALEGNESMQHVFQYSLTVDPVQPDNIYFCAIKNPITEVSGSVRMSKTFDGYGVYKSADGGMHWKFANAGLPANASVNRLALDPANAAILYAALNVAPNGQPGSLFQTTDRAAHWTKVKIPPSIKAVNNVFVDRHTGAIFISCGTKDGSPEAGGVWRSQDGTKSWKKIFDMPYVWQTETSPLDPAMITVAVAAQVGRNNVVSLNPGAYLSRDGGNTWTKINQNLGQPDSVVDLKPDPYRANVLWCALKGSGWSVGYLK